MEPAHRAAVRLHLHRGGGGPDQGAEDRGNVSAGPSSLGAWEQRADAAGGRAPSGTEPRPVTPSSPFPHTCLIFPRVYAQIPTR